MYLSPLQHQIRKTLLKTTLSARQPISPTFPNSWPPKPLLQPLQPPSFLNSPPRVTYIAARLLRLPLTHLRSNITLLVISHFPTFFLVFNCFRKKILYDPELFFCRKSFYIGSVLWLDCITLFTRKKQYKENEIHSHLVLTGPPIVRYKHRHLHIITQKADTKSPLKYFFGHSIKGNRYMLFSNHFLLELTLMYVLLSFLVTLQIFQQCLSFCACRFWILSRSNQTSIIFIALNPFFLPHSLWQLAGRVITVGSGKWQRQNFQMG